MPDMSSLGRWILVLGLIIAGIGGIIMLAGKIGLPIGRLPGDIRIQSRGLTCFFPLASTLLLSILLTVLLNLIARWLNK
jgi:hypothetical protein